MSDSTSPESPDRGAERQCAECGAVVQSRVARCWLCGAELRDDSPWASPAEPVRPAEMITSSASFSLSSLMLVMTLIAVAAGTFSVAPGLGIALAVLVTPAFIRTLGMVSRTKRRGTRPDIVHKVLLFGGSLGVVTTICVASCGAFYATCWAGFFAGATTGELVGASGYDPIGWGLVTGVILGVVVGLVVLVLLTRKLWPQKN